MDAVISCPDAVVLPYPAGVTVRAGVASCVPACLASSGDSAYPAIPPVSPCPACLYLFRLPLFVLFVSPIPFVAVHSAVVLVAAPRGGLAAGGAMMGAHGATGSVRHAESAYLGDEVVHAGHAPRP